MDRIDTGQVTTATPARLDFRAAEAAGEGCADAMSASSPPSMVARADRLHAARQHQPESPDLARACQWRFATTGRDRPTNVALSCEGMRERGNLRVCGVLACPAEGLDESRPERCLDLGGSAPHVLFSALLRFRAEACQILDRLLRRRGPLTASAVELRWQCRPKDRGNAAIRGPPSDGFGPCRMHRRLSGPPADGMDVATFAAGQADLCLVYAHVVQFAPQARHGRRVIDENQRQSSVARNAREFKRKRRTIGMPETLAAQHVRLPHQGAPPQANNRHFLAPPRRSFCSMSALDTDTAACVVAIRTARSRRMTSPLSQKRRRRCAAPDDRLTERSTERNDDLH